jgi:hypothetical protein
MNGYKTIIVNGVLLVFSAVSYLFGPQSDLPDADAVGVLVDQGTALWVGVVNIINIVLRAVTTGAVFWRAQ